MNQVHHLIQKQDWLELDKRTISDNSRFFDSEEQVPKEAWTMGLRTIMDSKEIYLIAQGKSKWEIIREAFFGEITESVPKSIPRNIRTLQFYIVINKLMVVAILMMKLSLGVVNF